ncbi:hypothetical protein KA005_40955, partial [bacterium]|nr:hypothetical protein [bacterium]
IKNSNIRNCSSPPGPEEMPGIGILIGMPAEGEDMFMLPSSERPVTAQISGCDISNNSGGVFVDEDGNATINCNNIYGNEWFGIWRLPPTIELSPIIDAKHNWWGDPSGPCDPSNDTATGGLYNPDGTGNMVSDDVDYAPWARGTPPCPCAAGPVGGIIVPVDKLSLSTPYIIIAALLAIIISMIAVAIYTKPVKHRKKKQ